MVNLGSYVTKIGSGATPRGGSDVYLEDGPFALVRSQNVLDFQFKHDGLAYISDAQARQLDGVSVEKDDILINITGDSVARVCLIDPAVLPARVNQHVSIVRADRAHFDQKFLFYVIASPAWKQVLLMIASSGATRNALTKSDLERLVVPKPSLPEQHAIVNLLGSLDDKIELNRRMATTLEEIARVLFKSWFVDFDPVLAKSEGRDSGLPADAAALYPDRFGVGGLPEGWREQPMLEQAFWVNGAAYKDMHFSDAPDALPVVKIAELKNGIVDGTKWTNTDLGDRYKIREGELLFSWSGSPDTSIDAFIWTHGDAWLNQHIFAVRPNGEASLALLYAMLKFFKPALIEIARDKQTTGLGHVTRQDMIRLKVCVGEPRVREAFDQIAEPLFSRLKSVMQENSRLAALRDTLLPKLISGDLRIKDAQTAVEAA